MYAELLFEITETQLPPKKEPKEGEEPEEEDDETKEKRKRNEEATAQLKLVQPDFFKTFVHLAQLYSD